MRRTILLLFCIVSLAVQAQQDDIKHTVETFFEGFHHRDTILLKQVCSDEMILQSIIESASGNQLSGQPLAVFYKSVASIPERIKINEKLLSFTTQADGTLGHAWTPYEFYIDGKLSHTGVNAFTLFKEKDVWKIVHIIDTRRKPK